jgi:CDGSH-type Zn-finger protein
MDKSIIADNKPISVQLKKDQKYYFCACGRSKKQPFCDGSHKGTLLSPIYMVADKDGEAWLCACKQSKNQPYCDGSHQQITDEQVGAEGNW